MAKTKMRLRPNNRKEKWTNDAKEQLSLEQGSTEYREYQEDLMEVNPLKPDDEFHVELEEHNAKHDDMMADRNESASDFQTNASHANERRRMYKESRVNQMKAAVQAAAAATPTKADDARAARISADSAFFESNIEYDNGVSEEGYIPQSIAKYL